LIHFYKRKKFESFLLHLHSTLSEATHGPVIFRSELEKQRGKMGGVGRTLLMLTTLCGLVSVGLGESCEMLETAADAFSVQFPTDRRGQLKSLDTIEVSAYFSDIVDKSCADDLVLTMEQPDGSWQEVEAKKQNKKDRNKGQRFNLWKVSPIIPCRTNRFRLMSGEHFVDAELAPAALEDMEDFEYKPGQPQNTVYADSELKWDALECATGYNVEIMNANTEETIRNEVVDENSVYLSELEYCEEYEYFIVPVVGETESLDDEVFGDFTKEPNHDILSDIKMIVETTEDTAVISWEITDQVRCVDKYEVEVCEAADNSECLTETVYSPVGEYTLTVQLEGLKQATAYQIILAAVYRGDIYYKDVKNQFNTKLDMEEFKVEAVADFETVTITWSDVAIAESYILYRQYSAGEWVEVAEVGDDVTFQSEEEPCMDIAYAVGVVTSDMNYDKKESNTVNLKLDESLPFSPSEQSVFTDFDGATLSWTHLACIEAYQVFICDDQMVECSSNITLASDIMDEDGLFLDLEDLTPCTSYNIEVVPHIGDHAWQGTPLLLEVTTEQYLEPPPQDSLQVSEWSPDTPVRISWDNTSCAETYEVFFEDTMDQESYFYRTAEGDSIEFDSPERNSCTEYEFQIVAIAGENRSEDSTVGHFFVGPTVTDLLNFEPEVMVGISSVDMTIPNSKALKCIDQYHIQICDHEGLCPVNEIIETNADDEETFPFSSQDLISATEYTVSLSLVYAEETLHTFQKEITTQMDLEGVELQTSPEEDLVYLEWQEVYGADKYEIGIQYGADGSPEAMETSDNYTQITQRMCSKATYSLRAMRQGEADPTIIYSEEVTTFLNDTEPYMASNLVIDLQENTTTITWDHLGSCIDHYVIILNDSAVLEHTVAEGDSHVLVSLDNLEDCKQYKLKIVPVFTNYESWEAEPEVQQEFKRLDDKKCVIPKVTRQAVPSAKRVSGSSSPKTYPVALATLTLISAIVRYAGTRW